MFSSKTIAVVGVGKEKANITSFIAKEKGKITSSVTKSTNFLITMDNTLVASQNAKKYNIPIYNISEFQQKFPTSEEKSKKRKADSCTNLEIEPLSTNTPKKRVTELSKTNVQKSNPTTFISTVGNLVLKFVNRVDSSKAIAEALVTQKTDPKGMLPILSQHFGSGKTAIVENFRTVLREQEYSRNEPCFAKLMRAALVRIDLAIVDPAASIDVNMAKTFRYELLERIRIALFKLRENTSILDTELEKSCRIITEVANGVEASDTKALFDSIEISIFAFLLQWSKQQLYPLLIFFDELGALEHAYESTKPLMKFWNALARLMGYEKNTNDNIFVIVAGKSATLAQVGRQVHATLVSPTPSTHIVLGMLSIDYVIKLIETALVSTNPKITAKEFLENYCSVGENFEYFCKVLYEYSGGIPRLVVSTIISLTSNYNKGNSIDLSSRANIDEIFLNFKQKLISVATLPEINSITTRDHPSHDLLEKLYHFSTLKIPVEYDNATLEMIYDLNIGIEEVKLSDDKSCLRLIVPKFLSTVIRNNPFQKGIMHDIYSHGGFDISQIVDKGALLEVLVRDTLIHRLLVLTANKKNMRWCDVHPCFSKCQLLADEVVKIESPSVTFMPIIVTKNTNDKTMEAFEEMGNPWTKKTIDSDWPKVKNNFFSGYRIVHPGPKSRSSDLFFNLPPTKALCFAIKNFPNTIFNRCYLQQEIDKAFLMLQGAKGSTFTEIALFIFCNGIEKYQEINKCCGEDGCLVLSHGVHILNKKEGTCVLSDEEFNPDISLIRETPNRIKDYSTNTKSRIFVPEKMEVIILGKSAFETFFTADDIKMLDRLSSNELPDIEYVQNFAISSGVQMKRR